MPDEEEPVLPPGVADVMPEFPAFVVADEEEVPDETPGPAVTTLEEPEVVVLPVELPELLPEELVLPEAEIVVFTLPSMKVPFSID